MPIFAVIVLRQPLKRMEYERTKADWWLLVDGVSFDDGVHSTDDMETAKCSCRRGCVA